MSMSQFSFTKTARANRRGFTLVELLVVIAIIGILVALLLPAVQAAREAARRAQCTNQVKQLALASLLHNDAHGYLPSGGWGWNWVGDPDLGSGKSQPGSWVYSILPYMEETALHSMGAGETNDARKREQLTIMNQRQPGGFICPSRRSSISTSVKTTWFPGSAPFNMEKTELGGKSDYAINVGGNTLESELFSGPLPAQIAVATYVWPEELNDRDFRRKYGSDRDDYDGVCAFRSQIRLAKITDGTSKTYFIGDKYLRPESYDDPGGPGNSPTYDKGDNETIFSGLNRDTGRICAALPQPDRQGNQNTFIFGSAHPGVFNMSMCDGSVQSVSFDIELDQHRLSGSRNDGGELKELDD